MKAVLCDASDSRWKEALARIEHDVFHLPGYLRLEARRLQGTPVAAVAESGDALALLPLVLREHERYRIKDAISPYGYPGLVCRGSSQVARAALTAFRDLLATHDVACAFVREHTLLSPPVSAAAGEVFVEHGETVWLDLRLKPEEILSGYRATTRNLVRRLGRDGFKPVLDRWEDFDVFQTMYQDTMRRVSASDMYFFSPEYFAELREVLGDRLHICVIEHEGKATCAGLFTRCGDVAQYYLSGTDSRFAKASPTRLMIDSAWRRLKELGVTRLHLGGGVGGQQDALFKFKAGFSKLRARFRTQRLICDSSEYQRAVSAWEMDAGREASAMTEFFPPYRAPLQASLD